MAPAMPRPQVGALRGFDVWGTPVECSGLVDSDSSGELVGSTKLAGHGGVHGCGPSVLAGAGPAYATALIDRRRNGRLPPSRPHRIGRLLRVIASAS